MLLIRNSIHKIHFQDTRSPLAVLHTQTIFPTHFPFFWYYPSHTSIVLHKYEHGDNMGNIVGSSMTSLYSACHCFQNLYLHTSWRTLYLITNKKKISLIFVSVIPNLEMNFPTPFDVRTFSYCFFNFLCTYKSVSCDELRFSCKSILLETLQKKNVSLPLACHRIFQPFKCSIILIQMFDRYKIFIA